jgi:RNA polymerase sigma-70 factor (ECF subfamily)
MPLVKSQDTYVAVGAGAGTCPSHGRRRQDTIPDRMSRLDRATLSALYQRHLKDVLHYVLRRVPRIEEAEDITAEVFAAAAAGLNRHPSLAPLGWVPGGHCPPNLWLLSIARRQIALARRQAARRETLVSELATETAEAEALWGSLAAAEGPETAAMRAGYPRRAERTRGSRRVPRRVLRELVLRLNADQREALMLHYLEQLPIADVALVMGRSPGSVKGLLQRARASLYLHGRTYFTGDEKESNR